MALVAVPQPMALVVLLPLALAAALVPEAKAEHHRRGDWAPPPPPPTDPFYPPPDVCNLCDRPIAPPMPMVSPGDFTVVPGFAGLSAMSAEAAAEGSTATGGSMSTTSAAVECVAPLAGLSAACSTFLKKSDPETPAPQSRCCAELVAFVNGSSAADDGGHGTLRCISPLILRHVNKLVDVPLDEARMMYLPVQCGVVFPPETLYVCMTGQQKPPLVSRIPERWEKPV